MTPTQPSLANLTAEQKRALAAQLLAKKSTQARRAPLSFAQQRLWFLDQLEPGHAFYNLCRVLHLQGELNPEALSHSLTRLVQRHEMLRTTFAVVDGEPCQVIAPTLTLPMPLTDLTTLPEAEGHAAAERLALQEAQRAFDLNTGPLVRVQLVRLTPTYHRLILSMDHIATDGWSLGVFFHELAALYAEAVTGQPSTLPALTIQYADFARWQREWLQGPVLEQQITYWRQHLAGVPVLALPTDHARPDAQSFRGAAYTFTLTPELSGALKLFSREHGATLFMTLLAGFQATLYRHTGQSDIPVGTPVANRARPELERLIGFFVNTLVLRVHVADDPTFFDLLNRVREVALAAFANQDAPFEKLVEWLRPERTLSHMPLFQVMFVLQSAGQEPFSLPGLTLKLDEVETGTALCDLTLTVAEDGDTLSAAIQYSTDLFEPETIARFAQHWQILLASALAQPRTRIGALPLLSAAERHTMLAVWPVAAQRPFPAAQSLPALFAAQVARTPDALAARWGTAELTYSALNARANQLAWQLRALGVQADVPVGVYLERSLEFIIALLGISKAGGAYVPLDLGYPPERLSFMLADTRAPVLVTTTRLTAQLPAHTARVICLDEAQPADSIPRDIGDATTDPPLTIGPHHLAYVIYTSGSTGQPKGVAIPHQGVVRLVCNSDYVQITPADSVAQASNGSFDAATFEIWGALLNGACLIGVAQDTALAPHDFVAFLRAQRITTLFLTTALFNQILAEIPQAFESLRQVLFGGEAVDPRWVRTCLQQGAPARLLHVYGPTENTTYSTWSHVTDLPLNAVTVPIGRPLANSTAYVLDRYMNPVPLGVAGELYLGDAGLARGYWQRPRLTAEKFVPHPYSTLPGERLYRTGDLVRWQSDGQLEFLGRIDRQVKLRGFRVELGEIEAALGQHPGVQENILVVRDEAPGDRRLVAYVVPHPTYAEKLTARDLATFLKTKLPSYMVPAACVLLAALPLTPNGKVDQRALPAPEWAAPDAAETFVAPQTPDETALAQIWREVLGAERIGIHDNFFELGGHSLKAVQVAARVREVMHVEVRPRHLFETPTISALATVIEQLRKAGASAAQPAIVPLARERRRVKPT